MRILVTGGAGFLGSHLVRRLSSVAGTSVVATYRTAPPSGDRNLRSVSWLQCDLADAGQVAGLIEGVDAVVHAAASLPNGSPDYPLRAVRDNVLGTANVALAAAERGVARIVYCSTISAYEGTPERLAGFRETDPAMPRTPYAQTKVAAEGIVAAIAEGGKTVAVSLRLAGIHGPGRTTGAIFGMARAALAGDEIRVDEPSSRFGFLFAEDAARAVGEVLFGDRPTHACYNIGGGSTTLGELAELIRRAAGSQSRIREDGGRKPPRNQVLDTTRVEEEFGFRAASLDDNVRRFVAYVAELQERATDKRT